MNSDIHALSGAYAVDAVDDRERAAFEAHLDECADCQEEVASLREAAATLAEAVAMVPSADLRERVLAGIGTVRPLPPRTTVTPTTPPVTSTATGTATGVTTIGAERGRRAWFPILAVAATILLVLSLGAAVWQPWTQAPGTDTQLSAADRVLEAPDAEQVDLGLDEGSATLVRSRAERRAVLVTEDMPSAPSGKVYELWLQLPQGDMVPAGLMSDEADQTVVLEGDAAEAIGVGLTIEPDGGAETPSLPPVALVEFDA